MPENVYDKAAQAGAYLILGAILLAAGLVISAPIKIYVFAISFSWIGIGVVKACLAVGDKLSEVMEGVSN